MPRLTLLIALGLCALAMSAQTPPPGAPGPAEIEDAYRSSATLFGRRRPVGVRGWKVRFEKLSEQTVPGAHTPGMVKRRFRVRTAKGDQCQEFLLTESVVLAPFDRNVSGGISVEPLRSGDCKRR